MTTLAPPRIDPTQPAPQTLGAKILQCTDLAVALLVVGIAAAGRTLPEGSQMRLVLTLPVLLFIPGYLFLQALLVPVQPGPKHWIQALLAIGLSLPLIGLMALSTSLVEGGFKPTPIVIVISLGCVLMAGVAMVRRLRYKGAVGRTSVAPTHP